MLYQNKLHTKILENFQPKPTVDDKYGVHFEYKDLFGRLLEVKASRSKKIISHKNKSPNQKLPPVNSHKLDKTSTTQTEHKLNTNAKSSSLIKGRSKSIAPSDRNISPMKIYETSRKSQIIVKFKSSSHKQLRPNTNSTQNLVKKRLRNMNQNPIFKNLANNHGKRVFMNIPESIIKGFGFSYPTLIHNTIRGLTFVEIKPQFIRKYLGILDYKHKQQDFPFAVIQSNEGVRLTFSLDETEQIWSDLITKEVKDIVIQRYIESRGDKAHIIRLVWNLNSPIHVQFIHSNIYYTYTVCEETPSHTKSEYGNRQQDIERDRFLVTENSTIIPTQLTNSTSYLKQQILAIKELIENYLLRDAFLHEITVDFIQDSMQRYHLIKIRNYKHTTRPNTSSHTKSNRTDLSSSHSMPNICIQKLTGSHTLNSPLSEYFRNTHSNNKTLGNSPHSLLSKRTLSAKNLRVNTANSTRVKCRKPTTPPYVYNKEYEKILQLDEAVDNLLAYKSTLIKHMNYRKWIQRRNENQPLLPHDKLFANKLSVHLDTIKKQADESHNELANMLDTMYRLTEGRYLTVTLLIKETMKFLLERGSAKKVCSRSGSELQRYKKIEEKYQKILNKKIQQSSEFRVKQQIDDGARIYDDVMKKVYS